MIRFLAWVLALGLAGGALADPSSGIVVDREQRVYFADERHDTVWRVEPSGKLRRFVRGRHTHRLALDAAGNLLGEDLRYIPREQRFESSLWSCTPKGKLELTYGPAPGMPPGLLEDADGNRYEWQGEIGVASRIVRRTPDGRIVPLAGRGWGLYDEQGEQALLGRVVALAWGPGDVLYFTDDAAVRTVDRQGRVDTLASGFGIDNDTELPGDLKLWGLAVDETGTVYVANYGQRRVLAITPAGATSTILRAERPWSPTGVAVRDGALYVLEHGFEAPDRNLGPRVRKRDAAGHVSLLAVIESPRAR